jgi:DNA-binding transcriptional MerR regulator
MPALAPITIAGLAAKTGLDVESIRTYERMGLIEKPRRGPGGYLLYRGQDVEILTFIRRASALGFAIPAIRDLLGLAQPNAAGSCGHVHEIATRQLAEIRQRIEELGRIEKALSELASCCPREGSLNGCPILSTLVQPA